MFDIKKSTAHFFINNLARGRESFVCIEYVVMELIL